ncbi:MAG: gamma-glutamyl-gamma-aminobutyrate hydrolase family protein [Patescibacteria group bacterium]
MKKLIAITQRVTIDPKTGERRDALDQNWMSFFEKIDATPLLIPNMLQNPEKFLKLWDVAGIILSGGNDLTHLLKAKDPAPERDKTEKILIEYGLSKKIPMVGVCRGMEMLGHYFGMRISPVNGHCATRHHIKMGATSRSVNSFHDYGILTDDVQKPFHIKASCGNVVEAFEHEKLPIVGIMWHPEREKPSSLADLRFFKKIFS